MKPEKGMDNIAAHARIGQIGEQIAGEWLIQRGFSLIDRNYRRKWGEIDLIARETPSGNDRVRFIEVKTVSYETRADLVRSVSRETYRPEEMVHTKKLKKLERTIETWIAEHRFMGNYQLDVITVRMVPREKYAVVKCIENVILE